jgi:hypothetical protein
MTTTGMVVVVHEKTIDRQARVSARYHCKATTATSPTTSAATRMDLRGDDRESVE